MLIMIYMIDVVVRVAWQSHASERTTVGADNAERGFGGVMSVMSPLSRHPTCDPLLPRQHFLPDSAPFDIPVPHDSNTLTGTGIPIHIFAALSVSGGDQGRI